MAVQWGLADMKKQKERDFARETILHTVSLKIYEIPTLSCSSDV
jgi:hypothetical protein